MHAYPYDAYVNSYTAKSGVCTKVGSDIYAIMKIGPNKTYDSSSDDDTDWGTDDTYDYNKDDSDSGTVDDYDYYKYNDTKSNDGISLFGENYSFRINKKEDFKGNTIITSEMKFDKYFLYGIDNMGG